MAERFRQGLPDARVRPLDDASHRVFVDQPGGMADELRTFLGP